MQLHSAWYRFLRQVGQDGGSLFYFDRKKFAQSLVRQFTSPRRTIRQPGGQPHPLEYGAEAPQTRGLDLAVAWTATTCQYVRLGQGRPVKAGSPVPMALGLFPPRGRRTRPRSSEARWKPSRTITAS